MMDKEWSFNKVLLYIITADLMCYVLFQALCLQLHAAICMNWRHHQRICQKTVCLSVMSLIRRQNQSKNTVLVLQVYMVIN